MIMICVVELYELICKKEEEKVYGKNVISYGEE